MRATAVLGLDVGTQSLKAIVCDAALRVLGEHRIAYGVDRPAPDRAEQDPAVWERALAPAIAGALAAAGLDATAIAALAITGQLDGCIAVDAAGEPLGPALIWQDRRAIAEAARVAPGRVHALTGQVADASHLAPKLAWLRAAGVAAARWHQPVSYLVERLTGAAVIDRALASTTMLVELATGAWCPELLAAFGVSAAELPRIARAADRAGALTARGAALTGLPIGVPVAVGTGDDFATVLGAGTRVGGPVLVAIGTAEVVAAVTAEPVRDGAREPMLETHVGVDDGTAIIEHPGWLAGGAVRWACELLGVADARALDELAAAAPPGADGVVFVPALAGAMTPHWRPHARATFHGMTAAHERRHLARAVLEGVAFACRDVVDRLAVLGVPTAEIAVVGGGAASAVWAQIRANVLARPHHVARYADTAALGAALLAARAIGASPDLGAITAPPTTFTPEAAAVVASDAAYRRYRLLVAYLAPLAVAPWQSGAPEAPESL